MSSRNILPSGVLGARNPSRSCKNVTTTAVNELSITMADDSLFGASSSQQRGRPTLNYKQRNFGKKLLVAFKDEKLTGDVDTAVVECLDALRCMRRQTALGGATVLDAERTGILERLTRLAMDDMCMMLRQLFTTMERYIPRTNQSPGTPQRLKELHSQLAQHVISVVALYWSVNRNLDLQDSNSVLNTVRASVPPLMLLLEFLPVGAKVAALRLLSTWCEFYHIEVLGENVPKAIAASLPAVLRTAGDWEQQTLIGDILRCLWKSNEALVEDIAASPASGLRNVLYDFCQLFRTPGDQFLPVRIAHFLNDHNGIHRLVFSFPLAPQTAVCHQFRSPAEHFPLGNPYLHYDGWSSGPCPWQLNFSTTSSVISFEMAGLDDAVCVVKIPAAAVISVEAVVPWPQTARVELLLADNFETYLQEGGGAADISSHGGELVCCDKILFHLTVQGICERALLEQALHAFFAARKPMEDFNFDVQVAPDAAELAPPSLAGDTLGRREAVARSADPTKRKTDEADCYRDVLKEYQLFGEDAENALYVGCSPPPDPNLKKSTKKGAIADPVINFATVADDADSKTSPTTTSRLPAHFDMPVGSVVIPNLRELPREGQNLVLTVGSKKFLIPANTVSAEFVIPNGAAGVPVNDSHRSEPLDAPPPRPTTRSSSSSSIEAIVVE